MTGAHALKVEEARYIRLRDELLSRYPELVEDEETLRDTLEGLSDIREMILAVWRAAEERKLMAEALKARIEQMQARRKRLEAGAEKMRDICLDVMQRADLPRITADDVTLSVGKGRPKVIVTDQGALPVDYLRVKTITEPDKEKLADALKAGAQIPGAMLSNAAPVLTARKT